MKGLRLGLCCTFRDEPIKFVNTTPAALGRMTQAVARSKLSHLCIANAQSLLAALQYCSRKGIGCFSVHSQIMPLKTHPQFGYAIGQLPNGPEIVRWFVECGKFAQRHHVRTSFHPDHFVILNSPHSDVVEASIQELEDQLEIAEWVHADVFNVHAGVGFGDKQQALADLARTLDQLSPRVRSRLTLENDDKIFTPADLLPVCREAGVPFVYDVHHHRCNRDGLTEDEVTEQAVATWNREPLFRISSPREGWDGPQPERHHDFIDLKDFPKCWLGLDVTVEVEAKAKELAVLKLAQQLSLPAAAGSF